MQTRFIKVFSCHLDVTIRRRCATFWNTGAQFNTVCTTSLGSQAALNTVRAYLKLIIVIAHQDVDRNKKHQENQGGSPDVHVIE